jgi:hypothetical protein
LRSLTALKTLGLYNCPYEDFRSRDKGERELMKALANLTIED